MGSSSAFTVGLLHALHALRGEMPTKRPAGRGEHPHRAGRAAGNGRLAGPGDGGLRRPAARARSAPTARSLSNPLILPPERVAELKAHLMLFYTGIARTASDVAQSYVVGIESRGRQLRIMKELVEESIDMLASGMDIRAFGDLLHEAWQAKRSLSARVSNREVDELYERARSAGAVGGKLTGAGGGGFLLLFVPPEKQAAVARGPGRSHSRAVRVRVGRQPDHFLRAGGRLPRGGKGPPPAAAGRFQGTVPRRLRAGQMWLEAFQRAAGLRPPDGHIAGSTRRLAAKSCTGIWGRIMNQSARIYVAGGETLAGAALLELLRDAGYRNSSVRRRTSRTSRPPDRSTISSPRPGPNTSFSLPASPAASG